MGLMGSGAGGLVGGSGEDESAPRSSHCYLQSAHVACDQIRTPPGISSVIRDGLKRLEWERDAWKETCEYIMAILGEGGRRGRPMDLIDESSWKRIKQKIFMAENGLGDEDMERDI